MEPAEEFSKTAEGTTVEELERFRQDIERYRARRKAVSDEFEGFVQSFRKPPTAATSAPAGTPSRSLLPPTVVPETRPPAAVAAPAVLRATVPPPPPAARPAIPAITSPPTQLRSAPASRSASRVVPVLVLAGLVILAAVWMWPAGDDSTPAPQTAQSAQVTPPVPQATAPAPPAPTTAVAVSDSELTTTRAVWIRVIADGVRVVNRELPADSRVPFKAEKTIEIRAGDAGAVRLSIGGRDQGPFGRDGQVATRSFTVPPR